MAEGQRLSIAMTLTQQLAQIACALSWRNAPEAVQERILLAVQDSIACGVAGSATDLARLHVAASGAWPDGPCTVFGTSKTTTPQVAAFHNAVAINAMDYDDTASVSGHPGATILGAALAVAQAERSSGPDLLDAVLTGYEVAARVAVSCRPSPERYALVHGSQSFLGFGAAAAAGRLLGLNGDGMARAFGTVAAFTPIPVAGKFGWDEETLSWIKDQVNWPAEAGVRAAYLAASGFPASRTIFDGPKGFWRMVASDHFASEKLIDAEYFHTADLAFKAYPCCRWLHGALDAFTTAFADADRPHPDAIRQIRVHTTKSVAESFGNRRPKTMIDAQFSAPHGIAALCLDRPRIDWWREESRTDPASLALMDKVVLLEDPGMTAEFLRNDRNVNRIAARVEIEMQQGRCFAAFCKVPAGTPGVDGSLDFIRAKHLALLVPTLQTSAEGLLEAIRSLPDNTTPASLDRYFSIPQHKGCVHGTSD